MATDQAIDQARIFLENERVAKAAAKMAKKTQKKTEQPPKWVKSLNDKLDLLKPKSKTSTPPPPSPSPSPSPPLHAQKDQPPAPNTPRIYTQMFPGHRA